MNEEENETHIIYIHNECNPIIHTQTQPFRPNRIYNCARRRRRRLRHWPYTRHNQQVQFTLFNAFLIIRLMNRSFLSHDDEMLIKQKTSSRKLAA